MHHARTALCVLTLAALGCVPALRAGEAVFAAKPSAVQQDGRTVIRFALAASDDVEVAVLNAQGKVVRHLAAGVLGGKLPPPPPLKAGLSQELAWDGRDDFKKPAGGGPFKVRVRAGTGVAFDRFIGGDDPYMLGLVSSMASDRDGNLYVLGGREEDSLTCMTLRAFSPDGKYLRTIMPFPADLDPGAMKDVAAWDEGNQCFRPRNYRATNVQFYSLIGGNGSGQTPSAVYKFLGLSPKRGLLLSDRGSLMLLDPDGSVCGESFKARRLWAERGPRCGELYTALSPDDRYLYISGPYSAKSKYGHKYDPNFPPGTVYRLDLDGDGPAEVFASVPVAHTEGLGGKWTEDGGDWTAYGVAGAPKGAVHGVAVDAQGRVYVADREHGRVAVFDAAGKDVGSIAVRWPDQIAVHPITGAIYVLEKTIVPRKSVDLKLLKFDGFQPGAKPVAERALPKVADRSIMAASFPGKRAVFWLRTGWSGYAKYTPQAYEDTGSAFEPLETAYKPTEDAQWGWHRIAVDYDRDELYGLDGTVGAWRYDGKTGKGERLTKDGKPFWSQDLAVGYDGLLYVRQGRGAGEFRDYSGPFARFTRELEPAPYAETGSHVLRANVYSRQGPGYAERGIGVGPDGKAYISFMYTWAKYWVIAYGADGKFLNGKHLAVQDKALAPKNAKPEEIPECRATIGPLTGSNGGLRVDLDGNIYSGMWLWPKDAPVPERWSKDKAYLCTTGSVFKFGPDGGFVATASKDWGSDPFGGTERTPGAQGIEVRSGDRSDGSSYDGFVEGAQTAYAGLGPFSHNSFGSNSCCVCRTPRFDLDRYGRLYLPNAMTNAVRIVDNAGNEILSFGKYGNFDSGYVNPNLDAGKAGKPTVAVPGIPLGWPTATGVSEDAVYVCDTYNRRAVRVRLISAAEETCEVKQP